MENIANDLALDLISAVTAGNPDTRLWTPAHYRKSTSLSDLVVDQISEDDDPLMTGLLEMWARNLAHTDPEVRLPAQALLSQWAEIHAAWHFADACEQLAEPA